MDGDGKGRVLGMKEGEEDVGLNHGEGGGAGTDFKG